MSRYIIPGFRFIGNTVAVVAIKPIEKGEELCNCYGIYCVCWSISTIYYIEIMLTHVVFHRASGW